jgi:hypothetical protein
MSCRHTRYTDIATHCYSGSVAGPDGEENRAAHGNVCVTYECRDCGARARANENGRHVEWGQWGPPRADREQAAREAERTAEALRYGRPAPITLSRGETTATIDIDREGYLFVRGDGEHPSADVCQRLVPHVVEYARDLRAAHLRAVELRAEV